MIYFEHALVALVVQVIVRLLSGSWWAGAAVASAYFLGREIAQAEYRWIELCGAGLRANMPWWGPFDLRVWSKLDQWIDWSYCRNVGGCLVGAPRTLGGGPGRVRPGPACPLT